VGIVEHVDNGIEGLQGGEEPPMTEIDIALEDVTKGFGEEIAVNSLSLGVQRGEFLSVIGPSGCGKTTTLRLIAGLEEQDSGRIVVRGESMDGVPPYRRQLGLVFQSFALFPHLDVLRNVEFGLRMRRVDGTERSERARRALHAVGLEGFEGRDVGRLSGGQMQRVAIARALVIEPTCILLDEPLGSLDAKLRIEMQGELKQLQRDMGITFVHVSHNQSEALAMADRIAVMSGGVFKQLGTPQEIYATPANRFVAEFVGQTNIFEGVVQSRHDGQVAVQTDVGSFAVARGEHPLGEGDRISFVVRPHLVRPVTEGGAAPDNTVNGEVVGLEYAGSAVTSTLRLPDGGEIKVEQHESLTREQAVPRHGERITVGWNSQDVYVLPPDGEDPEGGSEDE
jgi:ABC-type Fe3+/spermidine/putrescine transport system ATPase subunit